MKPIWLRRIEKYYCLCGRELFLEENILNKINLELDEEDLEEGYFLSS